MSVEMLIEAIHASPVRLSLCLCGAGAGAIARLTQVPECSRTLLQAEVLYHRSSTRAALDGLPAHIVSVEAARRLAQHAFHNSRTLVVAESRAKTPAVEVASDGHFLFGVGATSALQTSRQRHTTDRVFVSVWGGAVQAHTLDPLTRDPTSVPEPGAVFDYFMEMPGSLDRAAQDRQVELMVLHAIAEAVARSVPAAAETQLVRCGANRVFPASLFRSLLPLEAPHTSSPDSAARLCAVPTRAGPHAVSLDMAHEVAEAVQSVLSYQPAIGGAEDVCVLWNRHGELRRGGRVPYDAESDTAAQEAAAAAQSTTATIPKSLKSRSASPVQALQPLRLLYPGSFNPLHYGHTELAQAAIRVLRQQPAYRHDPYIPVEVTYEIAVKVVDKGAIACDDLQRRVAQFLELGERVAVTNAKLFISKAKLFPGHGFLIGIDTAVRVVDPQHYSTSSDPAVATAAMVEALQRDIGDRGCYFVVGGRTVSEPVGWQELSSLAIPPAIQHLFVGIPAAEFKVDVSSTELRARRKASEHKAAETHSNM